MPDCLDWRGASNGNQQGLQLFIIGRYGPCWKSNRIPLSKPVESSTAKKNCSFHLEAMSSGPSFKTNSPERNIIDNQTCPYYSMHPTSSYNVNLYQQCDLAQTCALDQFKNTLRMSRIGSNLASLKQLNQEEFDKQLTIPICLTLYAKWCIRNKVVFENHMPNPMEAINLVRVSER